MLVHGFATNKNNVYKKIELFILHKPDKQLFHLCKMYLNVYLKTFINIYSLKVLVYLQQKTISLCILCSIRIVFYENTNKNNFQ